ncbi:zinc finger protein 773-like isoform X2 [Dendropsophus ebraccatus]|uniref:zinc finger protein 773-like isoform X2 n=1 Tax=Dendropsophus ebraccatus TaxID=150705 RepID=UPI003831D4A7
MDWDKNNHSHRVLIFAIKLRQLLTGESYALLKVFGDSLKRSSQLTVPADVRISDSHTPSKMGKNDEKKILDLTRKIIQLLTGEVPIRYEDIAVFFTMEEWEYVEEHMDVYKDVLLENTNLKSVGDQGLKDIVNTLSEKISHSRSVDQVDGIVQKIFDLTKEIIRLLTKEKYILIWSHTKASGTYDISSSQKSSLPSLIYMRKKSGKMLKVANKIIELLTGETSIRYEDIAACFSMEEWEYVNGHKDFFYGVLDNKIVESYSVKEEKSLECPKQRKHYPESSCDLMQQPSHKEVDSRKSRHKQQNIEKHKENHIKRTLASCCKCGKRTAVRQMSIDTADSTKRKEFCRKCLLVKKEKDLKNRQYPCAECDNCFSNKYNLEIHMRSHTGEKPYKCSECGKSFKSPSNLKIHYRVHTGEKPFPCSECDKTFRYKSHLNAHQRVHTGKTVQCSECGKSFVYESHLVKHLRIHTGVKPFECLECGKRFRLNAHLTQHMVLHTGQLPYKCTECQECFRFHCDLLKHQKIHTGKKPFSCSECGKCFTRSTSLNEHKKIHTGEKPYSCPKCGKCFVKYDYVLRHLKTHTKHSPKSDDSC